MAINSIVGPALQGIQRGFQGMRRVASEIASVSQTEKQNPTDLSRATVEMNQQAHQAKVLKAADDSIGTLFDERV
ncbi:MAG: hydrolase [endosymbiont of Seepiophila jonesi]|uniref:Hydrolase n=1 Tax=endosymbiont of Lamellibrachia luymesi TaxID=2200907 RepID=A0A370DYU3_9GAMM|nr:MAG: hydrolase [endosymbiont of Seepiophila jonesi]RDH91552.1 MAG: hydrolase [endosymbiont of Lamellibrachia luymesi]